MVKYLVRYVLCNLQQYCKSSLYRHKALPLIALHKYLFKLCQKLGFVWLNLNYSIC